MHNLCTIFLYDLTNLNLTVALSMMGTYKVQNETKSTKTKRNEINKNETKPTKAKRNQLKHNEID